MAIRTQGTEDVKHRVDLGRSAYHGTPRNPLPITTSLSSIKHTVSTTTAEIQTYVRKQFGVIPVILISQKENCVIQLVISRLKMTYQTYVASVMKDLKDQKHQTMKDARARQDLVRHVSHGIHRHHMLTRIQSRSMELLETTSAEIRVVSKIRFGAIRPILILLGRNVIQLVHLFSKMLKTLQGNSKRDNQQEEEETTKTNL